MNEWLVEDTIAVAFVGGTSSVGLEEVGCWPLVDNPKVEFEDETTVIAVNGSELLPGRESCGFVGDNDVDLASRVPEPVADDTKELATKGGV